MKRPTFLGFLVPAFLLAVEPCFAQPIKESKPSTQSFVGTELGIRDYLEQVSQKHDSYLSSDASRQSARLSAREAHFAWVPSLYATIQHVEDEKPSPSIQIAETTLTDLYQVGVSQATSIGLSGKLHYDINKLEYDGLTSVGREIGVTQTKFVQASPVLELTMPLWRNFWGGETKSTVEQGDATAEQTFHNDTYQMKSVIVQSALAYWNLALAREAVRVAKDSVDRDRQLVKWHASRAQNGLGDRADLLQAEAALQTSLISLKSAQDSENTNARAFNMARGQSSTDVSERLMPLTAEVVDKLKMPERQVTRDDVKAAMEQSRASRAAAEATRQKYLPKLELYGTLALNNGVPTETNNAYADSFRGDRPTKTIGIRLDAPLDFGLIHDVRAGYARQKIAADLSYQRKVLEEGNDWNDLVDKYNQAKERSVLYQELEIKQKTKFDYERNRRSAGRTTTQQVLLFESDYEQAQLNRIQSLSDLFQVYAQMQLYSEVNNGSR